MGWHPFPESVRRRPIPPVPLVAPADASLSPADYRGRFNVVLLFTHGVDCPACRAAVRTFAAHGADYRAQETKVLIVSPGMTGEEPFLGDGPISLVADPGGKARRTLMTLLPHAAPGQVLLFVLDRYGAPYAALTSPEVNDPALQDEILAWLGFVEVQCPE